MNQHGSGVSFRSDVEGSETWMEVLMPNGVWVRAFFRLPAQVFSPSCQAFFDSGDGHLPDQHEGMHRCAARALLHDQLLTLLPALMLGHGGQNTWFRTLNAPPPGSAAPCLWSGAKLRLHRSSTDTPSFGLCFARKAFVGERDAFDLAAFERRSTPQGEVGWVRSEPSDSDRLRVNKRGREVLYFVQPPPTEMDLTLSELRAEIASALQISDVRRIILSAGSFVWGPEFVEDGLGLYSTYFNNDIVVEGRHMKTVHGAALVDVNERTPSTNGT